MLNTKQREAVEAVKGQVLVLAGAGTGKTTVLVEHVKHLILDHGINPANILATTFTVKATQELRHRLASANCPIPEWIGTFHGLCMKIVRSHISPDIKIIETEEQKQICKRLFGQESDKALDQINIWKNNGKKPDQVFGHHQYKTHYRMYQRALEEENQMDFGDLIMECCHLWMKDTELLKHYQRQFTHICIDEFQDTNAVQFLWLQLLTGQIECEVSTARLLTNPVSPNQNHLFCVGDDDQAIYGFRGSDNKYILHFRRFYPQATLIKLEDNYRSTPQILNSALKIASQNSDRLGKVLRSQQSAGEPVKIMQFNNSHRESSWLVDNIFQYPGTSALLVRTTWQVNEYSKALREHGLIGASSVKLLMDYLRFLDNPTIEGLALIVNSPKRGFGKAKIDRLLAVENLSTRSDNTKTTTNKGDFHEDGDFEAFLFDDADFDPDHAIDAPDLEVPMSKLEQILAQAYSLGKLESISLLKQQCLQWLDMPVLDRINSIWSLIAPEQKIPHYVLMSANKYQDRFLSLFNIPQVNVLTIHAAKGLEFDNVYLLGWEEGIFPHSRSGEDLESERRLAYVAITRGKKRVWITCCLARESPYGILRKGPSSFLNYLT